MRLEKTKKYYLLLIINQYKSQHYEKKVFARNLNYKYKRILKGKKGCMYHKDLTILNCLSIYVKP